MLLDKYATAYTNATSSYVPTEEMAKTGDATWEVYGATANYGWNQDGSYFVYNTSPFFVRGGSCNHGLYSGAFCSYDNSGNPRSNSGFRVLLTTL